MKNPISQFSRLFVAIHTCGKGFKLILVAILSSFYLVSCVGDDTPDVRLPEVSTGEVTGITNFTAESGGTVDEVGSSAVVSRGVCWSTSPNPTIAGSRTSDGAGLGSFSSNMTGLVANTMYYARAYATNSEGTAYGEEVTFTTTNLPVPGTFAEYQYEIVTDREGSTTQPVGGGHVTCQFVDGVFFDMDPYAVSYTVLFYDMSRSMVGQPTTYPADREIKFAANAGSEIFSGIYGNQILTEWYTAGSGLSLTRFTEDKKLFLAVSWCTTGGCEANDCYFVTGKAKVTVHY